MRGKVHLRFDLGDGSSGDAEWCALLHALDIAAAARERDIVLLGDSASVIDQAKGIARRRLARDDEARVIALSASIDRLRFRRIRRHQNLAGIALDQLRRRRPVR